jgi:uncharacterized protein
MVPHLTVWWRIMKIQISGLSEGSHNYQFREPVANVGLGEEFSGEVEVEATLEKSGTQLYLKAGVCASGNFVCDRCAAPFRRKVTSTYRIFYVWDPREADIRDASDVQVIPAGLPVIDLSDDVRQTVLLAVPLKLLCSNACKGLCPRCGADLNKEACTCPPEAIDGRWETLRGFQVDND